ncbi:MAG: DNA mismatch repair protein MutS, partial [Myxococcota bacterium]
MSDARLSDAEVRSFYQQQATDARSEATVWKQRERWLGHARLVTFVLGLVAGWFIFGSHQLEPLWILPPIILFVALLMIHDRTIQKHNRAERVLDFFQRGLGRLDHTWAGQGNPGELHSDPAHPYANDLDIFGEGSLFELLCTTRTRAGEEIVAKWLLEPTAAAVSRQRQDAVRELTDRVTLRRDLWLLGSEGGGSPHGTSLPDWAESPLIFRSKALSWIAAGLTGLTLATALGWFLTGAGILPLIVAGV